MIVWNSQTGVARTPQEDPQNPGEHLLRDDDVKVEPPTFDINEQDCKYVDSKWVISKKIKTIEVNGEEVEDDYQEEPSRPLTAREQFNGLRQEKLQIMELWGKGLQDRPFTEEELAYRQKLRDIPETTDFQVDENGVLTGVKWPDPPEST